VGKARAYPSGEHLELKHRTRKEWLARKENTLAYSTRMLVTKEKSFMTLTAAFSAC